MSWHGKYIGIPFVDGGRDKDGLDCWGLIRLVYAEQLGIDLPGYGEVSASELTRIARSMYGAQERWDVVAPPMPFDLVAMRFYGRSWVGHVGLMVDDRHMIHTEKATAVVCIPLNHFTVRDRIDSIRRYRVAA